MLNLTNLAKKAIPPAPHIFKLLGPSFILLGLGLGSGELILWPYLVANFGLGIIWGALVGITFQFFMNMEVERYSLINGESIFVGFARKLGRVAPIWFIFSTLIPWMWPGIISSSSKLFSAVFGIANSNIVAIIELFLIGAILTLGPTLYKTVERFQKTLILLGVPAILLLVFLTVKLEHLNDLFLGLTGIGPGYYLIPAAFPIASFLAAFAYTGAGGNLNLAQSFYIKEKGYGMGKYSGKITSLLTGKKEHITLEGATFDVNSDNVKTFEKWWKAINIEHFIVFWGTGLFTVLLLALLAYVNTYGTGGSAQGIQFMLNEAMVLSAKLTPLAGVVFLLVSGVFLFATQLTVFDATSRIMTENLVLLDNKRFPVERIPKYFYTFLWIQILISSSVFLFGISEPIILLTVSGVLNALAMVVHIGLTVRLNTTALNKYLRPSVVRLIAMTLAGVFFACFSIYTILQALIK